MLIGKHIHYGKVVERKLKMIEKDQLCNPVPIEIDLLCSPIAREDEQQFAVIKRDRSGQDSGEIGYAARVFVIERMNDYNQKEIVASAIMLLETMLEYTRREATVENKWMMDRLNLKVDGIIKGTTE
jgi:hypothetical protein